jgi:hypothetical protein
MPGLVPGNHVFRPDKEDVDVRDKPGHDGCFFSVRPPSGRCLHVTAWFAMLAAAGTPYDFDTTTFSKKSGMTPIK